VDFHRYACVVVSVVINLFLFAAAVTAAYSTVADADVVSMFAAASVAASRFHRTGTHAVTAADCYFAFRCWLLLLRHPLIAFLLLLDPELTPSTLLSHCHHRR